MLRLSGRRRNRREPPPRDDTTRKCSAGSENFARLPADGKALEDEQLL